MAVHWSWAFGAESGVTLQDHMGWTVSDTNPTNIRPESTADDVYTYAGSPTRYSMACSAFRKVTFPAVSYIPQGWIATPIKARASWYSNAAAPLMQITGGSGTKIYVYCTNVGSGQMTLYIDTTLVGTFTLAVDAWHYMAIKYDQSGTTWTADVYINGVSVLSGSAGSKPAETTGFFLSGGFATTHALIAQAVIYDWTGTGQEEAMFVTRCDSISDRAVTGTWTPSTGTDQFDVIDSPFSTATYTENASASVGDFLECRSSPLSAATQLNLTGVTVRSVCTHDFSEGTGVSVKASICDSTACASGSTVTPATGTTSYCFAVSDNQPAGGVWQTGSSVIVRHEIV